MRRVTLLCGVTAIAGSLFSGGVAIAQDAPVVEEEAIVVTGTRRTERSAADTPAPVDVIGSQELLSQADSDLADIIRTSVPSFNVNTQPISDAATLIRPANLRGLPPDNTLILVNGKRRHRAAVIAFLGGGLSDGAQGADISVIPAIALSRVEVLRDGAASQYGSDAIAGVMNFILRDSPDGGQAEAEWGQTYEGDGTAWSVAGNIGLPLGAEGFLNISAEYGSSDATSRSVQRDDAAALIAEGNTHVADLVQPWGSPNVDEDYTVFVNSALPLGEAAELYAFGNLSGRRVENGFFFRNPNNRAGVFAGPRFNPITGNIAVNNDNGTPDDPDDDFFEDSITAAVVANPGFSVSVGDMSIDDTGDCPLYLPLVGGENSSPDAAALTALEADDNCFSFVEMFPGGFTPRFGGELEDKSIAIGLRGELGIGSGLHWDASYYYGQNDIDFFINNTINASLGPDTPTSFRPGGYSQIDENFNLDFSYAIPMGMASDLNVAFGAEHRSETFEIRAGDLASHVLGPLAGGEGAAYPAGQGFSSSSNGFGGFTQASEDTQENYAVYLDLEADVTERLVLQAAIRYEDFYDTYGATTNYKVGGLYRITDDFIVRSTWSTGFRVPTAGQANVTNVTTAFDGVSLVDQGTIPLSSAAGQFIADRLEADPLIGVRPTLTPEESENFTIGAGFSLGGVDITVDYFHIEVNDRIAISDQQDFLAELLEFAGEEGVVIPPGSTTSQVLNLLDGAGALELDDFAGSEDLTSFGFFTNSFSTRTQGIDVVASYDFSMMGGESSLALAANWTDTEVTDTGEDTAAPLSPGRLKVLEDGLPAFRGSLTLNHDTGPWNGLARVNYYGEFFECHLDAYNSVAPDGCDLPYNGDAQVTVDFELGYDLTENVSLALGAQNAFDSYPDENPFGGVAGSLYPQYAPGGFNGGFYYVRTRARF